ncbi:ribbon-helix-helix domain-containing protein, partial [Anabaena sp. CCAP 1446/1C]
MCTLTIRLPDDKHTRLKELAQTRGVGSYGVHTSLAPKATQKCDPWLYTPQRTQCLLYKGLTLCRVY